MNILGNFLKIVSFGESHGKCIGVVIDGFPSGFKIDFSNLKQEIKRRKPGQSKITTQRKELDKFEVLSGIFNGYTTGAPICIIVKNKDVDSSKYEKIRFLPRPGHADFTNFFKYNGFNDFRGGGRSSGRITVGFLIAGALAKDLLKKMLNVEILAYTIQIGKIKCKKMTISEIKKNLENNSVRCPDLEKALKMENMILKLKSLGDSIGGVVECQILNLKIGVGEPVFSSIESEISKAVFSIPAIKAIEFGAGFKVAEMKGSENNDEFIIKNNRILTRTNNCGGILGGISTGMPIIFRSYIKPTPSISKPQNTIDLKTKKPKKIIVEGRHDPCVVPRVVPVIEAMAGIVILDLALQAQLIPKVLK